MSGPDEQQHGRASGAQPRNHSVERGGDLIRIAARSHDVVAARRDRDEVGLQGEGGLDLVVGDLLDELATHREIRVGEVVGAVLRTSATRSAQPRNPPGLCGSGSPIPSVNESPTAT